MGSCFSKLTEKYYVASSNRWGDFCILITVIYKVSHLIFYNSNYFQLKILISPLDFSKLSCYNEAITNKYYLLVLNKNRYQYNDYIHFRRKLT